MSQTNLSLLKFVGGPLDGHEQFVAVPPEELDDIVLLPVGRVLALLHHDRSLANLMSVAVYKLCDSPITGIRYRYKGSLPKCRPMVGKTPMS